LDAPLDKEGAAQDIKARLAETFKRNAEIDANRRQIESTTIKSRCAT